MGSNYAVGAPDYAALMQAYGYGNPQAYAQPQGRNTTSRVSAGIKTGLFGAGATAAALYGFNPKSLSPVDLNGNLFAEGLHALEDASIQEGIVKKVREAHINYLKENGIAENIAREIDKLEGEGLNALENFVKNGKIAEGATDAQKALFGDLLKTKREGLYSEIKTAIDNLRGKDFKTEKLPRINEILKQHGIAQVADEGTCQNLINALQRGEGTAYTDALKEALAKDYKSVLWDGADVACGKASFETASKTSIDTANKYLSSLKRVKAHFESMPDTVEGMVKWLEEQAGNKAKLSTLKGNELDAFKSKLSDAAQKLLEMKNAQLNGGKFTLTDGTKRTFIKLSERITAQEGIVNNLEKGLQDKFAQHFDKARGVLKNGAPEGLVKYFKNFKWVNIAKKAGIIGGIAVVAGALFLGDKA